MARCDGFFLCELEVKICVDSIRSALHEAEDFMVQRT